MTARTPGAGLWAAVARCWDNLAGPGMTEQDRLQRDIAEARGFAYGYTQAALTPHNPPLRAGRRRLPPDAGRLLSCPWHSGKSSAGVIQSLSPPLPLAIPSGGCSVMSLPQVLVTRALLPEALDIIREAAALTVWPDEWPPAPAELRALAAGADGILTTIMDRVDAALLDAAPNLRVISQLAVGLDNIDLPAATRRGIPVGYTPGVLAKSTADLAFALLLGAARRTAESERWVRAGNWELQFHPTHWLGQDVHEACLGIVGLGRIGREIARRARGFDMNIIYHSRTRNPAAAAEYGARYVEFPALLAEADFVVLSVPLTPETHHLIGTPELALMKPSGILINVSRGPVVDPAALYAALRDGQIARAALDVTTPEPIAPDDPLLTLENLTITPHIGSAALPTRLNTMQLAARNLVAGLRGQPMAACANPEAALRQLG